MRNLNFMCHFKLLFVSLFVCVSALAVPLKVRDVVDPPITDPTASTVWMVGSTQQVLWDTSKLPPYNNITNKVGQVVLGFLDGNGENLMLDNPLAKGFNITQGSVQVVVPNVTYRTNYIVVLMGDSGNASPTFTITGGPNNNFSNSSTTPAAGTPPPTLSSSSASGTGTSFVSVSPGPMGVDVPTSSSGSTPATTTVDTTMITTAPSTSSSTSIVVVHTTSSSTSGKTSGAVSVHRARSATMWLSVAAIIFGGLLL